MLVGLLAALIPLLIHLFDRRRARTHAFAAIAFVLRSQRRTASRLKLKRLLLYTLRTLILLAIPLALARPELRSHKPATTLTQGPAANAIILDASFGTRFNRSGRTLFESEKVEALDALKSLGPEEPATVLVCGATPSPPLAPGFDRARLKALLDDASASYGVADMTRCLELAARSLEESPMAHKRLWVVSPFFASGFHLEVPAPTAQVVLKDVAPGEKLSNHALVDAKAEISPQAGPRTFQFPFTVQNHAEAALKDVTVSLQVHGQTVAKALLDVPADGAARKTLSYRFDASGTVAVSLSAAPADGLLEDDRRELVLDVPRPLKALVVNGEPSSVRTRDEAFFVDAALSAPGSPVQETTQDADVALKGDLEGYDVICLLNVTAPDDAEAAKLRTFVERGGGLLISAGDHVEPDAYNARLGALLPSPIRVVKTAVAPSDPDAERRAERFKDLSSDHPLFAPFTGKGREGLLSARFYRYLLLEAEANGAHAAQGQVLATFGDGAPALVASRVGKGRVLLFTSTLDRDWSDFPIRTSYLPLMQRFASFLAGALDERESVKARVGQRAVLHPEPTQRVATVRSPSRHDTPLRVQADGTVEVGPLPEPGLYQPLDGSGQPLPALQFAVALDPSASDLTRLRMNELSAYFGEASVQSMAATFAPPVPLWTWLLLAAVVAFFLEGTLLRS